MAEQRNQNFKVLVVDDSDFSRKTTVEILERHGFNVVGNASSAEKGLLLAQSTRANLYIVDVVMPKVSGIEFAKRLMELRTGVYIIMTSSLDMESVVIESISNGAIDFLTKPFTEETLINSVEKIEREFDRDK
ncbi:response regulator [Bacteriovorax sp. BSW11_IV]|uniref:response regulator n=1 Tax=Bacteriovorax sp. BSW11_IV TaxID=1353529 RepID=UPI0005592CC1|nr:response regulator [Bacteriovorax sp. BSW11_IV]